MLCFRDQKLRALLAGLLFGVGCGSAPPLRPPSFQYESLVDRYFTDHLSGHFPLTIQRGANLHPVASDTGHLFYTSNRDGSGDIWMRDLENTVNLPLVRHPAEQYEPAVTRDGRRLVFVSEDQDSGGDLRIVTLDPVRIVERSLEGTPPPALWENSENLSDLIVELAAALPPECQGEAAEINPIWNNAGDALIFASDRCSGRFNLWMLPMEDDVPSGPPRQLTGEGAVQPAIRADDAALTYISFRRTSGGEVFLLDLRTGVENPLTSTVDVGGAIVRTPRFNVDGSRVYYTAIREDSNDNGRLDGADAGALYSRAVADAASEEQLLEADHPVLGVYFADHFLGGALLYAAQIYNSVNVYVLRPEGVIAKQPTVSAQYSLTRTYRERAPDRYLLALEAVERYYSDLPEFQLYEGRVLVDRMEYLRRTDQSEAANRAQALLEDRARVRPFVRLEYALYREAQRGPPAPATIQAFIAQIQRDAPENADMLEAGALLRLAMLQDELDQKREALATVERLDQEFPGFVDRDASRRLHARLATEVNGELSALYNEIIATDASGASLERVHATVYAWAYVGRSSTQVRKLVERELLRDDLAPFLRVTLMVARVRAELDEKDYTAARASTQEILGQVPVVQDPTGRVGPAPGWSAAYVRTWQVLAALYDQEGDHASATSARLTYGGAYSTDVAVSVDTDDFLEIIEESESSVNLYLSTARSILQPVEDTESTRSVPAAITEAVNVVSQPLVDIGGTELDVLVDFCAPNSRNRTLFWSLGPDLAGRYNRFCTVNQLLLAERAYDRFPLSEARDAVDLLYTTSYANAHILNILFLNMKKLGVLPELYEERAVYYHRLKIDLASEKNRFLLASREREFQNLDQSDIVELFVDTDPYRSQTYDEIVHGYRLFLPEASALGDLSMHYGYAYALIQRSVEKEAFYDRVIAQGVRMPPDLLRRTKEEILQELKNAEYLLEYILNVDPLNVDAYLLLGWLYEYIDQRQSHEVKATPGYIQRIVDYFLGTTSRPSDRVFYANLYDVYFPDNLYEANVELYRQAIEKVSAINGRELELANLNLNLANNYFKLLNFSNAITHYEKAREYFAAAGRDSFANYKQRALFHYNLGRALFYEDRALDAAGELLQTFQIYDEQERKPLHEQFSTLSFMLASRQGRTETDRETRMALQRRLQSLAAESDVVRRKMSMVAALIGLAYWQGGEQEEAILFYRDAELRLYENGDPPEGAVDRASLANFTALALQSQGNFAAADREARLAGRYARDRGLVRPDRRYQPQSVGGKLLGCLLDYGEDFSVIGDGRNPYGFAPLRQYELSLGVQLENRILEGDLDGAAYLLRQRRQVFGARDADVSMGRIALVATLNQEAVNLYDAGNYLESADRFADAARLALSYNLLTGFRRNFSNRFKALFALFEQGELNPSEAEDRIEDAFDDLGEFYETYREQAREEFVAQKQSEVPDYEFDEATDSAALEAHVARQLVDLITTEAALYYYRAKIRREVAPDSTSYREDLELSAERYTDAIRALERLGPTAGRRLVRSQINRAQVLLELGQLPGAIQELRLQVESAYEFSLLEEEWKAHFLLARALDERLGLYGEEQDRRNSEHHLNEALNLLRDAPEMATNLSREMDVFFQFASEFYIERGDSDYALRLLEWRRELELQQLYFRFPLRFADAGEQAHFDAIRSGLMTLRNLRGDEANLRLQRGDFRKIEARRHALAEHISASGRDLIAVRPELASFVNPAIPARGLRPRLGPGQLVLRTFRGSRGLSAWCFSNGGQSFVRSGQAQPAQAFREVASACVGQRPVDDLFLILDENTAALPARQILAELRPELNAPLFATRLRERFAGFITGTDPLPETEGLHTLNARDVSQSYSYDDTNFDSDVAIVYPEESLPIFSASDRQGFNARSWVGTDRRASVVVLMPSRRGQPISFQRAGLIFDVLRTTGVGSVIVPRDQEQLDAVLEARSQHPYSATGAVVFGSAGFDRQTNEARLVTLHRQLQVQGDRLVQQNDLESARQSYQLAASYLWNHPAETRIGFENDLELALLSLRLRNGVDSVEPLNDLIRANSQPAEPARLSTIYRRGIETLLQSGRRGLANYYLDSYVLQFPDQRELIVRRTAMLEFRARLDRPRFGVSEEGQPGFRESFLRSFDEIARSSSATSITRDLLQHDLFAEARAISQSSTRLGTSEPGLPEEVEASAFLMGAGGSLPARPVPANPALQLLYHANRQEWPAYAIVRARLIEGDTLAVQKFRQRLFQQWERHKKGQAINVLDIADVTISEGITAYGSIGQLERALVYALLIASVRSDPELQTAQLLEQLTRREERDFSVERAFDIALGATAAYLENEDYYNATQFLRAALELEPELIASQDRSLRTARLGAILIATGVDPSLGERGEGWRRQLATAGMSSLLRMLDFMGQSNAPKKIMQELRRAPTALGEAIILIRILKELSLQRSLMEQALNLAFLEQALLNYSVNRGPLPDFEELAGRLRRAIPANQDFFALVDTAERAYRFSFRGEATVAEPLRFTGRYLRGSMQELLSRDRAGEPTTALFRELSRAYRSIFGISPANITYFWFGGIHSMAPIMPERGDRLFQIMNPLVFADASPAITGEEYPPEFTVGLSEGGADSRPADETERLRLERLKAMERLSLGPLGSGGQAPVHFFIGVSPDSASMAALARAADSARSAPAWFLSASQLAESLENEPTRYNAMLDLLANRLQSPGVITMRIPQGLSHAYFVRSYYSRQLPATGIARRFVAAHFSLRRELKEEAHFYGYRLVTPRPLRIQ